MAKFPFRMAAEFAVADNHQKDVAALVDKMTKLDPGTDGKTTFHSDFDAGKTTLKLVLHSASEDAQQKALLAYGPVLTDLAKKGTRKTFECSDNAPEALRAMLVPMEATFVAVP